MSWLRVRLVFVLSLYGEFVWVFLLVFTQKLDQHFVLFSISNKNYIDVFAILSKKSYSNDGENLQTVMLCFSRRYRAALQSMIGIIS